MKRMFLGFCFLTIVSCGTSDRKNYYSSPDEKKPLVDEKYSLTADRKKFDEMRAEIPPERKKENDEAALILQLTGDVKKPPSDMRNEFDKLVRRKREIFDKDMTKERDRFSKEEKRKRDDFLKAQAASRDEFTHTKHSKEERDEFFKNNEEKRKDYFADEREKRNDFESDARDKRKNFEDYIREKNNEFNQEYRAYSRRYDEMKKEERLAKEEKEREREKQRSTKSYSEEGGVANGSAGQPAVANPSNSEAMDLEREIEEIRKKQGSPLGSGE